MERPRRRLLTPLSVLGLAALMIGSGAALLAAVTGSGPRAASSATPAQPAMCDTPCGGSGGSNDTVSLVFSVSGVPSYYDSVYPVYVPVNIAYWTGGGPGTDFEDVPVAQGLDVQEGNAGIGFTGSYNAKECDLTNPNQGCFSEQNTIDYSNDTDIFDTPALPDSPYYYNPSSQDYDFINDCSGEPYGSFEVQGDGGAVFTFTLAYQDCQGFDYGNSGTGGVSGGNNSTGPWAPVNAANQTLDPINLTVVTNETARTDTGSACTVCLAVQGGGYPLPPTDLENLSTGGIALNASVALPNGTYLWSTNLVGFTTYPQRGVWTISTGTAVVTPVSILRTYPVSFHESGLPTDLRWDVGLSNATTSRSAKGSTPTVVAYLPNGTFSTNPAASGYGASGSEFVVSGAGLNLSAPFSGPSVYNVTVNASALPAGTPWQVSWSQAGAMPSSVSGVAGSGSSLTMLQLPNGTYQFSTAGGSWFTATSGPSTLTVDGAAQSVTTAFAAAATQVLTFKEAGLPKGSTWGVSVGDPARSLTTTTASLKLAVTAGIYSSEICTGTLNLTRPAGYDLAKVAAKCGTVPKAVTLTFRHLAALTVKVEGLPTGMFWYVSLTPAVGGWPTPAQGTAGTSVVFYVPVGSYAFTVDLSSSYKASPAHGTVDLSSKGVTKLIKAKETTPKV
jgi:hypothetical protein